MLEVRYANLAISVNLYRPLKDYEWATQFLGVTALAQTRDVCGRCPNHECSASRGRLPSAEIQKISTDGGNGSDNGDSTRSSLPASDLILRCSLSSRRITESAVTVGGRMTIFWYGRRLSFRTTVERNFKSKASIWRTCMKSKGRTDCMTT